MPEKPRHTLVDVPSGESGYKHFMRSEPRKVDSPIEIDPETGFRYQYWKIGMLRSSKDEKRKRVKVFLDPAPHMVVEKGPDLRGWYKSKFERADVRPRPCCTESLLTSPYGGACPVLCRHCYVTSGTRGYRGQGLTTVPCNYGDHVRKQLKKMQTAAAGYFSSFTEPFQVLETVYHNTQNGAQAFVDEGLPIFFLSRLQYPVWAYDLLKKSSYSYAQMSINTSSAEDWRRLSPRALPLKGMFDQVKTLHKAGIYVSIQVNPVIPGVVSNDDIHALIHELGRCGADHLIFKFIEMSFPSKQALIQTMVRGFGGRGREFGKLLTCNVGHQVTIDEEYRIMALDGYKRECRKAGVTMAVCYEYAFERDSDGRIVNRTGVSMGREYLTADQCHGHRVPLFTRVNERFQEVKECPPIGCLYCEDVSGGKPACGSEFYGSAPALKFGDLKTGVYNDERLPHKPQELVQIQKRSLLDG